MKKKVLLITSFSILIFAILFAFFVLPRKINFPKDANSVNYILTVGDENVQLTQEQASELFKLLAEIKYSWISGKQMVFDRSNTAFFSALSSEYDYSLQLYVTQDSETQNYVVYIRKSNIDFTVLDSERIVSFFIRFLPD